MRRLTSIAVSAGVVVAGLVGAQAPAASSPPRTDAGPPDSLGRLAIVPMDDRPFPAYTPRAIATAGGFEASVPPVSMLGEFLDPGDADGVGEWWASAADGADGSVVAVPMLAYGGLVASRKCDSSLEEARQRLRVFDEVKAANPDQPVYAFDVIMRLTIEPYGSYPGTYAGPIRRWAILHDQVVNLGREDLRAEYEQLAAQIPDELQADYWCTRERDHQINRDMVRRVADGTIDYLILGQDDTTEFGPQRLEQIALRDLVAELGVEDRVKIYPGADVVGALLTAKHVTERLDVDPTVDVEWSRTPGERWVAPYQDVPYAELVEEYVTTLGGSIVDDPGADVLLMANTAGGGSLKPFADRIHRAVAAGRLVAIGDDAVAGEVDPELYSLLAPRIQIGQLAAWSGWNVGISIAQAVVRASLLERSRQGSLLPGSPAAPPVAGANERLLERAAVADRELLLQELAHTHTYRNHVRDGVKAFAEEHGDDPMYMTEVFGEANRLAVQRTLPLADALYAEEFAQAPVRLGSDGRDELAAVIGALDGWQLGLAWFRYQEIEAYPTMRLGTGIKDRDALITVSVLPYAIGIRPEAEVDVPLTVVVRNDVAVPVTVDLAADVPPQWTAPAAARVELAPFEVREVPLAVRARGVPADVSQTVTVRATHTSRPTGERVLEAVASSVVTGVWRNVALASEGATATASGTTAPYQPAFAIDGNRVSNGSRWLTDRGDSHWLRVDFARAEPVDTVELFGYASPYHLRDYRVSGLVDGQWQPLVEVSGNSDPTTRHTFDLVTATAIRLDVLATVDSRARLYEIEVTCRRSAACDGQVAR